MPTQVSPAKQIAHSLRRSAASLWLNALHNHTKQIGITGSYGKTSTSSAIFAMLNAHKPTIRTDLNLDTIYNVPITALQLRRHSFVVFELGIDRPDEMSFHLEIVKPDIGVVTGIAPVHADEEHLGSLENIITEKRKLIEALTPQGVAILNYDDPRVVGMAEHTRGRVVWYGVNPEADYRAENIRISRAGSVFKAVTPAGEFEISTPLLGRHNCINLMAAVAVALECEVPIENIRRVATTLQPLTGRMNIEPGPLETLLINDALRANTTSTKAGLDFLNELQVDGRRVAVLGEMGEIGERAVEEHRAIGEHLATLNIDRVVSVGTLTEHIRNAAIESGYPADQISNIEHVQEAAAILKEYLQAGDAIYLKGSLMRHLERVKLILRGEEVGCSVIVCPFYHQCDACEYRIVGYDPSSTNLHH